MAVARTITFRRTQAIDSRAQLAGHGVIGDGAMETAAPTHPHMQEGEAPHSKTDLSASWTHAYPHTQERRTAGGSNTENRGDQSA